MIFLIDHNLNRDRCVEKLIEIVLSIDDYKGAMRIFIP
jgi:hypothetical protein